MDIQGLNLNEVEYKASSYLSLVESGQNTISMRSAMDGILPILEAISSGQALNLFAKALDTKNLCIASLCTNPPSIGISLQNNDPVQLIKTFDGKHPGKALRAICIAVSEREFPAIAINNLSKALCSAGLPDESNTLVRNGLYEIGRGVGLSDFKPDRFSIDRLLIKNLHEYSGVEQSGQFGAVLTESQSFIFRSYLQLGKGFYVKEFFDFTNSLSGTSSSLHDQAIQIFWATLKDVFNAPCLSDVTSTINLIMTVDHPALDDYRHMAIQVIDENLGLNDYLKASLRAISKLTPVNDYDLQKIAEVFMDVEPSVLTDGIRDRDDYTALAELPGLDMYKIDVAKIPKQARGAALENELGL